MRTLSIFGSTGSVGCAAIDLASASPEAFSIDTLTAHRDAEKLARQAIAAGARLAIVADERAYGQLKEILAGTGIEAAAGENALIEAAARGVDVTLAAIVGAAGLPSTLRAAETGGIIAVANKETLVCAGELVTSAVSASGAKLVPVDSEHSAIHQVFDFERPERVERIILTASGGPFRTLTREEMRMKTAAEAVAHPVWSMGAKISVDSATLMNKGLELIEAHRLFPVAADRIGILVHPQSIVHSLVEYVDGSVLAQLGSPDMKTPIAYALAYPERMPAPVERLDLAKHGTLTFERADEERFPALRLAREAMLAGGTAPATLSAANEVAVAAFLDNRIDFLDIAAIVGEVLARTGVQKATNLEEILACDAQARNEARAAVEKREN